MVKRAIVGFGVLSLSACSYLPAAQERLRAEQSLRAIPDVMMATVECGSRVFAGNELCAQVMLRDGVTIKLERLGGASFGGNSTNAFVTEAGGLAPRITSCEATGTPNFHRTGAMGHRFRPTVIDVAELIARRKELLTELQFWPRCPMFWEFADRRGAVHRYCARPTGAADEPPAPERCE